MRTSYAREILFFAFFLPLIAACGTLASRTQIISIDSDPRGAEFIGDREIGIGRTPSFVKITRRAELGLRLKNQNEVVLRCNVRWAGSLAGNYLGGYTLGVAYGVAPVVQTGVAITGVLADHLFGGLYTCPDHVTLALKPAVAQASQTDRFYCRTFLIAPVEHHNALAAWRMQEFWHQHARQKLHGCDRIVGLVEAQKIWDVLDYSNLNPPDLRHSGDFDKLSRMGLETGATHVVLLRLSEMSQAVRLIPQIYDLHRRVPASRIAADAAITEVMETAVEMHDVKVVDADDRWIASWFANHAPNALEYSPAFYTTLINRRQSDREVIQRSLRRRLRLPSYASSWQMTSAASPAVYPRWGIDAELRPSLATSYFFNEYVFSTEELPGRNVAYSLETGYAAIVIKAVAVAFTPVGSIAAFMGAGPVLGALKEDEGRWRGFTSTVGAVGFEYNLPVSDRWYLHGRAEGYALRTKISKSEVFDLGGWTNLSAGFGYYLPEMRRGFSRWFL